jgi:hypothetical protein
MTRFQGLVIAAGVLLLILLVSRGCHDEYPPLGVVTGRVTLDGEPVANAVVSFALQNAQPKDGIYVRPAMAQTDDDGWYTISYSPSRAGAPVGVNDVMVIPDDSTRPKTPGRYAKPGQITVDVKAGSNRFDLALTRK